MHGEKITEVIVLEELLPGPGSFDVLVTEAVLSIIEPGPAVTLTTRVMLAEPPDAIEPSEQVTIPVPPGGGAVNVPWLGVTDTNVVPAGTMSVTVTPVPRLGPALLTPIVYVRFEPLPTGFGEPLLVIDRSDWAVTVIVKLQLA